MVAITLARIINHVFDGLLVKNDVVSNRDFSCVHSWMDEYYTLCHWQNRDVNADVDQINQVILSRTPQAKEEVLTDYLRVALGHILLASLSDGFAFSSDYALMKTAFQLFINKGFNNCSINNSVLV